MASNPDAQPVEPAVELIGAADDRAAALRDVTRSYPTPLGPVVALDDVSLDVAGSGLTVITGQRGSGTTTLLRILACLDRPDAGQAWVAGADTLAMGHGQRRELRRTSIGVLQAWPEPNLLLDLDVGANIVWAAKRRTGAVLNSSGVEAHLEMVGLGGTARRRVQQLDPSDQQRLGLACALAGNPRILVADEPTARLDPEHAPRLINAMRDAADRGHALVVGTDDVRLVAVADAVVTLTYGRRLA